jgi:dethiobiotin synthetase
VKAFFVTGTDTGVGKTTVACSLLAAARARGHRVAAMKPIETGCATAPGRAPRPADALALEHAAARGSVAPIDASHPGVSHHPRRALAPSGEALDAPDELAPLSNVYRFAAPLAPSVAAQLEGAAIALAPIVRAADRLRSLAPDLFLVEGAGGILVPISESLDMTDLAAELAMPLILVARDGLGTINHTLLTIEAARARRLPVAAVVLSAAAPGTSERDAARNAHEIARRGRVPVAGRLPHLPHPSLADLAEAAEAHIDLSMLLPDRPSSASPHLPE